jgi:hypothetical protein
LALAQTPLHNNPHLQRRARRDQPDHKATRGRPDNKARQDKRATLDKPVTQDRGATGDIRAIQDNRDIWEIQDNRARRAIGAGLRRVRPGSIAILTPTLAE